MITNPNPVQKRKVSKVFCFFLIILQNFDIFIIFHIFLWISGVSHALIFTVYNWLLYITQLLYVIVYFLDTMNNIYFVLHVYVSYKLKQY